MTNAERRALVSAATLREVDNRDPCEVARWREAEAAALREVLFLHSQADAGKDA